jgi:Xaa-Pro aminopeptidase
MTEFNEKQDRVRNLLLQSGLEALLLRRVSSFAWATCGASSSVNTAATHGEAGLLLTPSGHFVITNNIEAPRLEKEEHLAVQGWQMKVAAWYEKQTAVEELARGWQLGADGSFPGATDLSTEIAHLRAQLTPEEDGRFRTLARLCSQAMGEAARSVRPGQSERQIAGRMASECEARGVQAIVNLVATDERIDRFRHPLPTDKILTRYALLVLCGRKWGLVCSVSRLVHFGHLSDDLRHKQEAVARIDAVMIAGTRRDRILRDIVHDAISAYQAAGFPDEWRNHHQGGPAGYEPREYLATPESLERVTAGQAYAWNPSVSGAKSEDTFLVGDAENEILTAMPDWPTLAISVEGRTLLRPAILEVT